MDQNLGNENKIVYLRLDDIIPNRFQPREVFDETGLEELADSIKEHGVIQPIIVRPIENDKYELIAGERRSKASALAGLTTIPAIVRNMDDRESAKVSLLENLQRKNLSPIEEARTYKRILELEDMSQGDLARTMGKSQPLIANKLRLLSLPEEVQDSLIKNQISERHARSLLTLPKKEDQLSFLERIKKERLTVRELDALIKEYKENANKPSVVSNNSETTNLFTEGSNMNNNNFANFGGMGLNDYQTGVSNNRFNNIPTNYDNFNNVPNMNNDLQPNVNYNNFQSLPPESIPQPENNSPSSLGKMFDEYDSTPTPFSNNDSNTQNDNFFVSHIKAEDTVKDTHQFIPNYDEFQNNTNLYDDDNQNTDISYPEVNTNFQDNNFQINNNQDSFQDINYPETNDNFQDNSYNQLNNYQDNNYMKEPENTLPNNDNYNYSDLNTPSSFNSDNYPDDFSSPMANQGELFQQPLDIIETNNKYLQDNNILDNEKFDNPLDDPYEDILFAKPVPISDEKVETKDTIEKAKEEPVVTPEIEVIGNENPTDQPSEEYIRLEEQRTIFDTKGAIYELKKTTDRIKANNIPIETEEIDYDDYYQITIKIKKEML